MHWSSKYAWESGTVDMAKANWSSAIITEQIQADIPPSRLDGIADNDSSSWRVDLGQLYPVTTTAYLKFWNMLTSITRDGHFGRWKTACFDSLLKMDQLAKKKKSIHGCSRKVGSVFSVKKVWGLELHFVKGKEVSLTYRWLFRMEEQSNGYRKW